jgi:hypothetical protein
MKNVITRHHSDHAQLIMINMPLMWHHIGIYVCNLFHMFDMVFGSLFHVWTQKLIDYFIYAN